VNVLRVLALFALFTAGCLRPSEDRAKRDLEIGAAQAGGFTIAVSEGHAVVRAASATGAVLWASAPAFSMHLEWADPVASEFSLDVQNCMPGAELTLAGAAANGAASGAASVIQGAPRAMGVCSYRLTAFGPALDLDLAVPGSDRSEPFRFAVLSDVQEALPRVQDIFDVLDAQPGLDFLLGAGDLTEQGTHAQLGRFQRELSELDIPYYTTLGNHELGQNPTLFHDYFGRCSLSFVHKGVRFTLLDSASATIDPIVLGWLDGWLAASASGPHVVAMHIAPLDPVGVRNGAFANRNEAAKLLGRLAAAGVDMTFYGHIHSYYHYDNAGIPAHISGGGGAIPEKFDDIGRHFLVVDADPLDQRFDVSIVRVD
jgi:3',5'-cyclic-AMP phosphodiesterase